MKHSTDKSGPHKMKDEANMSNTHDDIKEVSLKEMVEAMSHAADCDTFRWYQTTCHGANGAVQAGPVLRVTMLQARTELQILKCKDNV